jgi:hypothetical protein
MTQRVRQGFAQQSKYAARREVSAMAKWTFEPGHTAAEFRAHMMVVGNEVNIAIDVEAILENS